MNDRSASPAEAPPRPVLVWDAPVRVFHWLAVLSVAGAWLTAESERWRLLHVTLGYTLAGLVAFRIVWGLVGTRHARFANFVRGPSAIAAYLRGLRQHAPRGAAGHNPAGALAIVGLLVLAVMVTASGWALYNELAGEALEDLHELAANTMLALVGVHVAGVLLASRLHHENLVRAMFTGRQLGRPDEAIRHAWRSLAAVMVVAVAGFWAWQWQSAPAALEAGQGGEPIAPTASATAASPEVDAGRHASLMARRSDTASAAADRQRVDGDSDDDDDDDAPPATHTTGVGKAPAAGP